MATPCWSTTKPIITHRHAHTLPVPLSLPVFPVCHLSKRSFTNLTKAHSGEREGGREGERQRERARERERERQNEREREGILREVKIGNYLLVFSQNLMSRQSIMGNCILLVRTVVYKHQRTSCWVCFYKRNSAWLTSKPLK